SSSSTRLPCSQARAPKPAASTEGKCVLANKELQTNRLSCWANSSPIDCTDTCDLPSRSGCPTPVRLEAGLTQRTDVRGSQRRHEAYYRPIAPMKPHVCTSFG